MDVKEIREVSRWSTEKMQETDLFTSDSMFCDIYCLEPGQCEELLCFDRNQIDKVYVVLEGQGRLRIGNEEQILVANEAVMVSPPIKHGLINDGENRLVVMAFLASDSSLMD